MSGWGATVTLIAAIVCGSAAGLSFPPSAELLSGQIDRTVILLVFLLLFEVRVQDLLSSLHRVSFIAAALLTNFVVIPVLGFAISSLFLSGHPLIVLGLVIYFMAPCTDWFLGFTRLAGGNTALGAALLPINMVIQILLYPVYLSLFGMAEIGANPGDISETMARWFLFPLCMALSLRFVIEKTASKETFQDFRSVVSLLVPILLALLVAQLSAVNVGTLVSHAAVFPLILCAIFVFFALTFLVSEALARLMGLNHQDRVLMTMTTSARNAPLMLALTMVVMPDQPLIYAAIVIGMMVELPHLVALKVVLRRRHALNGRRSLHQERPAFRSRPG